MKYRSDIDGLRAVAVVPVVLFHAGVAKFGGGFVGVDVFFVISGFLITTMIATDLERREFSIARFYERRTRRILPAAFAMLVATSLAAWFVLSPTDLKEFGQSVVAASTFLSNVLFWLRTDYFDGPAQLKPLLHTWSLAVEEQFYIVFPLVLAMAFRWRRRGMVVVTWGLLLASLAASEWTVRHAPSSAFYLAPFRGWELLLGCVVALGGVPRVRQARWREAIAFIGLGMIAGAVLGFTEHTRFPGVSALLPCLGTACILHLGADGAPTWVGRALSTAPLGFVGRISYSLYLWHWPILVLAGYWFVEPVDDVRLAMLILLTFLLSTASWKWVEQPFRTAQWGANRRRLFTLAVATSGLAIAFGLSTHLTGGWPVRFSPAVRETVRRLDDARNDNNRDRARCHASDKRPIKFEDECVYGASGIAPEVALWGDSFAVEPAVALGRDGTTRGQALLLISYSGCAPAIGAFAVSKPRCESHNRATVDRLSRSRTIQTVILIARYQTFLERGEAQALPGMARVVRALVAAGKRVIVTYPIPQPPGHVPTMLAQYALTGRDPHLLFIPRATYDRDNAPVIQFLDRLVATAGVEGAHPERILCSAERCEILADEKVLYFDSNHLSVAGAAYVASAFNDPFRP